MELRHLRYFVAVAEELHFGRAARRLRISQPPLSAQIRDLEHELAVTLFIRTRHKVELTDAGHALLARARDVLARVGTFAAEAASVARGEQGVVTVGYTTTAAYQLLPRLLQQLRVHHPRIALRLEELASPAQPAALEDRRIDLGLACLPIATRGTVALPLIHEQMTLAIPHDHPLARRAAIGLADLRGVAQVGLRDSTEPGWAQACAGELARARVAAPVVAEADTKLALLGLVAAGLGVAVISSSLATLGRPGVVFRPIADSQVPLVLGAVHRPQPSELVRAVLDVAVSASDIGSRSTPARSSRSRRRGRARAGRGARADRRRGRRRARGRRRRRTGARRRWRRAGGGRPDRGGGRRRSRSRRARRRDRRASG
ncbi:MAG TPA: LysR substrate-binding domain-containing protein [Kofleriaceae bacterium]|nr:LysR substrate-binding domain-containing protein [Kofleriaceae bacterium]